MTIKSSSNHHQITIKSHQKSQIPTFLGGFWGPARPKLPTTRTPPPEPSPAGLGEAPEVGLRGGEDPQWHLGATGRGPAKNPGKVRADWWNSTHLGK